MAYHIINGPNLNLLGHRQPDKYGTNTLPSILEEARKAHPNVDIEDFQSNVEGELINELHRIGFESEGVVLNAGAYTHTSLALADAIAAIPAPVVEVHITNVHAREPIRQKSLLAPVCSGTITGFGKDVYLLALYWLTGLDGWQKS